MKQIFVRILFIPFMVSTLLLSLSVFEFITVCNLYLDGILNNKSYNKTLKEIKNVEYYQTPDSYSGSYDGSFYVKKKKVKINFGDVEEPYYEESKVPNNKLEDGDYNETKYHYVWYREGYEKAFPALPNEKVFPVWERLHKRLWLFYIWLFCLCMSVILWKTGIKMGFMKKENEEKNEI